MRKGKGKGKIEGGAKPKHNPGTKHSPRHEGEKGSPVGTKRKAP